VPLRYFLGGDLTAAKSWEVVTATKITTYDNLKDALRAATPGSTVRYVGKGPVVVRG
jgi:hypothetical protein